MPIGDAETCASPADEDCDGNECGIWAHVYGEPTQGQWLTDTAMTPTGDVYLQGALGDAPGSIVFDGTTIAGDATHRQYLAKIAVDGQELWARAMPSAALYRLVASGDGGLVLTVGVDGPIDLGGGPIAADSFGDQILAAIDADGEYLWGKTFGAPGNGSVYISGMGRSPTGAIVVFGSASPGAQYDGQQIVDSESTATRNWFMLAFDEVTGDLLWNHLLPVPDTNYFTVVDPAFDSLGNIVVVGQYADPVSVGGEVLPLSGTGYDAFIARYDTAGAHLVSRRFCSESCDVYDLAVGPDDAVYVAGGVYYSTLGTTPILDFQTFVARLGDEAGEVAWHRLFTGINDIDKRPTFEIAIESSGDLTFFGRTRGNLEMESETLVGIGVTDLVVGKLHPNGTPRWARLFGAPGALVWPATIHGLHVLPTGEATIAFDIGDEPIDVGTVPLEPFGEADTAIARLAP